VKVTVDFEWRRAGFMQADSEGKLQFPKLPFDPGIYVFRLLDSEASSIYVGESDNIVRRAAHYRNPGTQPDNQHQNEPSPPGSSSAGEEGRDFLSHLGTS
jgi:hypothetical protein